MQGTSQRAGAPAAGRATGDHVNSIDVATFSAVTRAHILQAIAEHDSRGADGFLGVYGFPAGGGFFLHEDRTYPAIAILGVAHRFATGRLAGVDEFHGGEEAAQALLGRRGFDVPQAAAAARAAAPARARSTATKAPRAPRAAATPRAKKPEPFEFTATCPTCSMVLPGTGVCDYCD